MIYFLSLNNRIPIYANNENPKGYIWASFHTLKLLLKTKEMIAIIKKPIPIRRNIFCNLLRLSISMYLLRLSMNLLENLLRLSMNDLTSLSISKFTK